MLTERDRTSFRKPGISDPSETACFLSFSDNPPNPPKRQTPQDESAQASLNCASFSLGSLPVFVEFAETKKARHRRAFFIPEDE